MISARSLGCSRARRESETESRIFGRVEIVQRSDVVPRDQRARNPIRQRAAQVAAAQAPHDPAETDVGGNDAQCAAGARDFDVVDAHDFAAIDIDDLLVEEILD